MRPATSVPSQIVPALFRTPCRFDLTHAIPDLAGVTVEESKFSSREKAAKD
jgi:hypothetical protein